MLDCSVIIENVSDKLSKLLYPVIIKQSERRVIGKEKEVELDGRMVPISSEFKLLITAVTSKPDFGPEISSYLILVNFELTEAAFDAQMMSIIMQEIETNLEAKQRRVKKEALDYIEEIRATEVRVLKMLSGYKNSSEMLENENLIEQLQGSQQMQERIGLKLKEIA
jgi:hypothetical protein